MAVGFSIDKQLLGRKTSQIGDISIAFSIPNVNVPDNVM